MKKRSLVAALASVSALSGCAAAMVAAPYAAVGAAQMVSDARSAAYSDVSIQKTAFYENADIKSVAFIAGGSQDFVGINATFVDNLTIEFLNEGFNVIDGAEIQREASAIALPAPSQGVLQAARTRNVDGLFNASAQVETAYRAGFLGVGADITNGIVGATLRLTDLSSEQVILVISANYKRAQPANEVAQQIAIAFRDFQDSELTATSVAAAS